MSMPPPRTVKTGVLDDNDPPRRLIALEQEVGELRRKLDQLTGGAGNLW